MIIKLGIKGTTLLQKIDRRLNAMLCHTGASRWIEWGRVQRILVVETGDLAEGLAILPTLGQLRQQCPKAEIHLLLSQIMALGMSGHPDIDRLIAVSTPLSEQRGAFLRNLNHLRRRRYDLALTCNRKWEDRLLVGLSGARNRIGIAAGVLDWLFTERTACQGNRNRLESNLDALMQIGCQGAPGQMRLAYGFLEVETIRAMLVGAPRPWIGLHPSPPSFNGWPLERFLETARQMQRRTHGTILATGSPPERDAVENALAGTPRSANFCGLLRPNLSQALIAEMDILITGSPAAVQMAGGVNTPTLAILDSQNSVEWAPLSIDSVLLESSEKLTHQEAADAACALLDRVTPTIQALTGGAGYGKAA